MKIFNILFLCTGNSARSILAEALITTVSQGKLISYSAGSHPKSLVHPIALEIAIEMSYPKEKLRSKNWNEFSHPNAPQMDFIITLCDNAKGEACPIWPGNPANTHRGLPDPALTKGSYEKQKKDFYKIKNQLTKKLRRLVEILKHIKQ